jgi:hypothetical protein
MVWICHYLIDKCDIKVSITNVKKSMLMKLRVVYIRHNVKHHMPIWCDRLQHVFN